MPRTFTHDKTNSWATPHAFYKMKLDPSKFKQTNPAGYTILHLLTMQLTFERVIILLSQAVSVYSICNTHAC